jgi:hypothetical protein
MSPSQVIFVLIMIVAMGSLALAGKLWLTKGGSDEIPAWRGMLYNFGFFALAAQFVLSALFWTRVGADYALFAWYARMVCLSFLISVLCILVGKGPARWWILASSSLLFAISFLIMLTP